MSSAKTIEMTSSADVGFQDAIKAEISFASQTVQNITRAWVQDQELAVQDGRVTEYRVPLNLTFVLKDGGRVRRCADPFAADPHPLPFKAQGRGAASPWDESLAFRLQERIHDPQGSELHPVLEVLAIENAAVRQLCRRHNARVPVG